MEMGGRKCKIQGEITACAFEKPERQNRGSEWDIKG
jgi:hypothetical protein